MISILQYQIEFHGFLIILLVALLSGMSKTGVHGAGILCVPLMAIVFGGHASSGLLLPIIILADIFGVVYYHRHADWKSLKRLLPWSILGIIAGTITGNHINDAVFKLIMAVIIIVSLAIMIWLEKAKKATMPDSAGIALFMGVAGGFTSMVGNLAGVVMALYFLSMRLPKNTYIGTTAWFFMIINWLKVPFHVFVWHTINLNTFLLATITLPAILAGAYLGIKITQKLSEAVYRWFIISMTFAAAVFMLF
ncbi:sulfite exporter TauE/SafE family protein [Rubrolithibacter danxiaensis]|uniref:sulfite exporter TauE/SafE family protein n=1 Tax=Rubrolithibacter danxiaensis TaxID=3390805 RepID=UPI003BF8B7D9